MDWQTILAALIFLQAPGKSIYSRVEVSEGSAFAVLGDVNKSTAFKLLQDDEIPNQCKQQGNVACSKPSLLDVSYNGTNIRTAWQRTETYDEGVLRYATIAKSIHAELTDPDRGWSFPVGQSWRFLVTIAYHESGFRRDIHSGLGSAALGDCDWTGPRGKRKRVKGSCRSHGLFQTLFDHPSRKRIKGYLARQIVGTSAERTRRQVFIAATHLDRLHAYCTSHGPRPFHGCVFASYGGVTGTSDARVQARVRTYNKLGSAPTKLDPYVRRVLGIDDGDSAPARNAAPSP